jgi:hypothetical protein
MTPRRCQDRAAEQRDQPRSGTRLSSRYRASGVPNSSHPRCSIFGSLIRVEAGTENLLRHRLDPGTCAVDSLRKVLFAERKRYNSGSFLGTCARTPHEDEPFVSVCREFGCVTRRDVESQPRTPARRQRSPDP